ncbi:MAG: tetratricopeptide repeat protein [Nitrospiraceae bacterium]
MTATRNRQSVCLMVVAVVAYANAFSGTFQYDDFSAILENPHLNSWRTFIGHLDHMVRPVLYATFLADRTIFGTSPTGYHLLNLLLHLGSGILVYLVLTRAVSEEAREVPFWTALLFLVHPLQTETVTYISGRASGLMTLFYLLALALYIEAAARRRDGLPHGRYVSGALLSFVLALGSKETAATLPLALLLWDALIRRLDPAALRKTFLSTHLPFWFVLLVVAAWAWRHPRYSELAQYSLEMRPLWDNLVSELHAVIYALSLFVCPWNQNFDHDLPALHSLFQWPLPVDLLILGAVAGVALTACRRFPLVTFGVGWFFLQLLPTSLIPRVDLLSERNLYLPSVGMLLAFVLLGSQLAGWLSETLHRPRLVRVGAVGLGLMLVLALSFATIQRNALYRDPVLLWSDAVEKSSNKARPHNNLGHAYAMRGDWENAIDEFRTAARLDPDYALAQKNLRDAYLHSVGRQ